MTIQKVRGNSMIDTKDLLAIATILLIMVGLFLIAPYQTDTIYTIGY